MDENIEKLSAYLKRTRGVCALTALEVAIAADCSMGHLSRVERGLARPSPALLDRLLRQLPCPMFLLS